MGAFGTFMHWPLQFVTIGSLTTVPENNAVIHGYSLLPLTGAALGTIAWLLIQIVRRPSNQRLERP